MVIQRHLRKDPLDILAEQAVIEEETKPACCHHWVIETANGPVSWGVCQICHEGKEFQNSIGDTERE